MKLQSCTGAALMAVIASALPVEKRAVTDLDILQVDIPFSKRRLPSDGNGY